jgi:hypothetical protein
MPPRGGISHIRAGLGVRKLATEAGFRRPVSNGDILVSRFLERGESVLILTGRVATLEEAEAQFQKSWDAWKACAKQEEAPGES